MKVWIVCVFVLFALVEFYQWLKHLSLPLPVSILGGILLAVSSNYRFLKLVLGDRAFHSSYPEQPTRVTFFSSPADARVSPSSPFSPASPQQALDPEPPTQQSPD